MGATFPNESAEYRAARDKLLRREVALRREMEAVAAERRALPPGGLPGLGGGGAALPGLGGSPFNLPPGFDKFSKK